MTRRGDTRHPDASYDRKHFLPRSVPKSMKKSLEALPAGKAACTRKREFWACFDFAKKNENHAIAPVPFFTGIVGTVLHFFAAMLASGVTTTSVKNGKKTSIIRCTVQCTQSSAFDAIIILKKAALKLECHIMLNSFK
jgi:hypothetical protein